MTFAESGELHLSAIHPEEGTDNVLFEVQPHEQESRANCPKVERGTSGCRCVTTPENVPGSFAPDAE